jgi:hypothetical protein
MTRYLPLPLIIGLLIAFRVLGSMIPAETLPNFQPLVALFFCGAMLTTNWRGFVIPAGIWAITYPFGIGPIWDFPTFITTLVALIVTYFLGTTFAKRNLPTVICGSVVAALAFHLITCAAAWLGDPMYQKTVTGLWQSLWTGPQGATLPSWVFLRNLAAANILFTTIFATAQLSIPRLKQPLAVPVTAK